MKSLRYVFIATLAFVFVGGFGNALYGQATRTDAVNAYNSAEQTAAAGDYDAALQQYENAMVIAEQCEDCADIVGFIEDKMPQVAFAYAREVYENFDANRSVANLNSAISAFLESAEVADEYGNAQIAQQSRNVIPQLQYTRGLLQYNNEQYEAALVSLDEAIAGRPNYANAVYQKALVQNRLDAGFETVSSLLRDAIELASQTGNNNVLSLAENRLVDEYVVEADRLKQGNQLTPAITALQQALELNPDHVEANYRLAVIYNERQNREQALARAQTALENEPGGNAVKARIWYEIGVAYQAQGSSFKQQACEAFSNASYGEYADNAAYAMEFELRCGE